MTDWRGTYPIPSSSSMAKGTERSWIVARVIVEGDGHVHPWTSDLHRNRCPGSTPEGLHHVVRMPAFGGLPLHLHDLVPCPDSGPGPRRPREGGHHRHPSIPRNHLQPHAPVFTLHADPKVVHRRGRHEGGVGIPEFSKDTLDGRLIEVLPVDRIHVAVEHVVHDFLEEPDLEVDVLLLAHPFLEEPTAGQDRREKDQTGGENC